MKKYSFFFTFVFINITAQFEYFPSQLNIQPFAANALEPKVGFLFQLSNSELRLDIGNSIDIFHYKKSNQETFSFGADFFTYSLLRGEKDFHFPVDAIDYLFGLNASYKKKFNENEYGIRMRLSHISAHFVDGHYDGINHQWRDGLNPRVYSREFIELIPYYKLDDLRIYAGLTYLLHVNPSNLGKDTYQFGFDYYLKEITEIFTPFIGYDLKITHLEKYSANHSIVAGVKFGKPVSKGISFYFSYYSGKSIHGEYFDYANKFFAIAFNLDL